MISNKRTTPTATPMIIFLFLCEGGVVDGSVDGSADGSDDGSYGTCSDSGVGGIV